MSHQKKAVDPSLNDCANCGTPGAKLTCAKCKATYYCSKACQRQHWINGHKAACITPEERRPPVMASGVDESDKTPTGASDSAYSNSGCPICLGSFSDGTLCTLPCHHKFHRDCVEELRKQGLKQACPLCRTVLPPGPEQLFEDALRLFYRTEGRHRAEGGNWDPLTAVEKENMAQVIEMWTNAANQGHTRAQFHLGHNYQTGRGVTQDYKKGLPWLRKAAAQGSSAAQYTLGVTYHRGEGVSQDYNEAARWHRIAASQGLAEAKFSLGVLYEHQQGSTVVSQSCRPRSCRCAVQPWIRLRQWKRSYSGLQRGGAVVPYSCRSRLCPCAIHPCRHVQHWKRSSPRRQRGGAVVT